MGIAHTREASKNTIGEHIGCALLEFSKTKLASKNRHAGEVTDLIASIRNLLERNLLVMLLHNVRGFRGRRRAVNDAVPHSFVRPLGMPWMSRSGWLGQDDDACERLDAGAGKNNSRVPFLVAPARTGDNAFTRRTRNEG